MTPEQFDTMVVKIIEEYGEEGGQAILVFVAPPEPSTVFIGTNLTPEATRGLVKRAHELFERGAVTEHHHEVNAMVMMHGNTDVS